MVAGSIGSIDANTADCDCCKHRETKKRRFQGTRPQYLVAEATLNTPLLTNAFQAKRFPHPPMAFPPSFRLSFVLRVIALEKSDEGVAAPRPLPDAALTLTRPKIYRADATAKREKPEVLKLQLFRDQPR